MDRDQLIDRVTEMTEGNRHDYLTRGDVSQIIDATLQVLEDEPDAGQAGEELEDVPQSEEEGQEQDERGEDSEQPVSPQEEEEVTNAQTQTEERA